MKFKTNVMCMNCVNKITPYMDKVAGKGNWEVDLKNSKRIMTVKNPDIKSEDVVSAMKEAGYKSEVA